MGRCLFIFFSAILLWGCETNEVFSEYNSLPGYWDKGEIVEFKLGEIDSLKSYNLFINIRNTNEFRFNNLFLITSMYFPHGKVVTDTLEYPMAYPDGSWLGTGGAVIENKLWYRENIRFFEEGVYTLTVQHAMRNNASVEGVKKLEGITDVGISMEEIK